MAFTIEQIEAQWHRPEAAFGMNGLNLDDNPNKAIITDYLTGKTSALQGIDPSQNNFLFFLLLRLLETPEAPTPNDRLLLDVFLHPDILLQVHHHFVVHLVRYLAMNDKKDVLHGIAKLLQKAGHAPSQIVVDCLNVFQDLPEAFEMLDRKHSPVKAFLVQHLPAPGALNNQHAFFRYHHWWNEFYFLLLDGVKQEEARGYLLQGLLSLHTHTIERLLELGKTEYIPMIADWIRSDPEQGEDTTGSKFNAAIVLYEYDKSAHAALVQHAARVYLKAYPNVVAKQGYEQGTRLEEFEETELSHAHHSALAMHFVWAEDKKEAIATLDRWLKDKTPVNIDVYKVLHLHVKEAALPYLQKGLQMSSGASGSDYYLTLFRLATTGISSAQYLPILWSLATTKSKWLRESVSRTVAEQDPAAEEKAIALLTHKSGEARQSGALVLNRLATPAAIAAVTGLLDRETADATRDIFLDIVKDSLPPKDNPAYVQHLIGAAEGRKKLAKPAAPWLEENELPPLYHRSDEALTATEIRFLFYRQSRALGMRSDIEANYLIHSIDKDSSAPFIKAVLEKYAAHGLKPDYKWLLALAALLGGEEVVDRLRTLINRWIDESRVKMAEYGVGALALQGSNNALRWVEWYSRKYKTKKAKVGAAALQALQDAADEQGISIHELGDRVVPDFGFEGLYKTFAVNGEEHRAFIDSRFKLQFFNEDGKSLKALPAGADAAVKEECKAIGKEVRDVVRSQAGRMEYYLLIQRRWTVDAWRALFLTNPVLFIYATRLLWGVYDAQGVLRTTFQCLEDTSLLDAEDNEVEPAGEALVGIVHPLELPAEALDGWKRKFFDASVEPAFPQLDRAVHRVPAGSETRKIVLDLEGKVTAPNAIKPALERAGWRTGGTGDGGHIDAFQLEDTERGITAVLEVEGVFVGYWDVDMDSKMGRLYFVDRKKQSNRWIEQPKGESEDWLVALRDLSPVFYSEVMYNVGSIALKAV